MKTIHQLAKIARRAPSRIRGLEAKLEKVKTPTAQTFIRNRISAWEARAAMVTNETAIRNCHGKACRDSRPLKVQKRNP